jgi:DNA-binding FrmR family transcriptional regulator
VCIVPRQHIDQLWTGSSNPEDNPHSTLSLQNISDAIEDAIKGMLALKESLTRLLVLEPGTDATPKSKANPSPDVDAFKVSVSERPVVPTVSQPSSYTKKKSITLDDLTREAMDAAHESNTKCYRHEKQLASIIEQLARAGRITIKTYLADAFDEHDKELTKAEKLYSLMEMSACNNGLLIQEDFDVLIDHVSWRCQDLLRERLRLVA